MARQPKADHRVLIKSPFIQGRKADDRKLFAAVGPWLVSVRVHDAVGGPVVARPGDQWYLGYTMLDQCIGFAVVRPDDYSKTVDIRYLYAEKGSEFAAPKLVEDVLRNVDDKRYTAVHAQGRVTDTFWKRLDFEQTTDADDDLFCGWSKTLDGTSRQEYESDLMTVLRNAVQNADRGILSEKKSPRKKTVKKAAKKK